MTKKTDRLSIGPEYKDALVLIIVIIALFVVMSLLADGFNTWYNIRNVLRDFSIMLIVSMGMTIAILLGKIDMSLGAIMSASAIATTMTLQVVDNIFAAVTMGILVGAAIGLLNGYLVGVQRLNHFIATFASMSIAKGLAQVACNGQIIPSRSVDLLFIGTGKIGGLFVIIWLAAAMFVVLFFVMKQSSFGYKIYSVGGSENAAELAGIRTKRVFIQSYILIGIFAAVAGICMAAKANSGNVTVGDGFEFSAIAIVLIGGTPFDGGKGGLVGTLFGALMISVLKNGISMLGFTPAWQNAIIGIVILVVIIMDVALNERRKAEELMRVWQ